jgi:hypothetical protein
MSHTHRTHTTFRAPRNFWSLPKPDKVAAIEDRTFKRQYFSGTLPLRAEPRPPEVGQMSYIAYSGGKLIKQYHVAVSVRFASSHLGHLS